MIDKALKLKKEIRQWCSEEQMPQLTVDEWKKLADLHKGLKVFSDFTQFFEGQSYPTMQITISAFNKLFDSVDELAEIFPNNCGVEKCFKKLKKYYKLSDDCPAHYLSTVLNPSMKMVYFSKREWDDDTLINIKQMYTLFPFNFISLISLLGLLKHLININQLCKCR